MIELKGYKLATFRQAKNAISKSSRQLNKSSVQISFELADIGFSTVQYLLNKTSNKQRCSDVALTRIANIVNVNLVIVYINGERKYFLGI